MTVALMEDLREAVHAYRQSGDEYHLWNWIRLADALRAFRRPGFGGAGTFFHFTERSPDRAQKGDQ
jgi:hypothetical protein